MEEAIVSTVLRQLSSIIGQQILEEVKHIRGARRDVRRLTNSLQAMKDVLTDAEQRQVKEASVRSWLDRLKDVSYDVEDVLDEWNIMKLKEEIKRAEIALSIKKKVSSLLLSPVFAVRKIAFLHDLAGKIEKINENLDDIAKDRERYNFNIIRSLEISRGIETTSFVDENTIRGRENEKDALIRRLLSNEHIGLEIISLVGMGGIGKTILAQLVYNDNVVKSSFWKRSWVCVSDPFDKLRVANNILYGLEGMSSNSPTLQHILENIQSSVSGKKILLVLDDIWTEDYNDWEAIYNCLNNSLNGSKILVTTRKEKVAQMVKSTIIPIKELSKNESWSLLKCFAFYDRSDKECSELESIGQEIVDKCKGLPLAIKTMGSLLRFKRTRNEWEAILDSELWVFEDFEKNVFGPLLLSYNDLSPMVKRCFSYCAVFPKDYDIKKEELVRLWMAQGYLELEGNKDVEIVGESFFNILATRSFFQDFGKNDFGEISWFKMHDVVHDFARFLTQYENSSMIDKELENLSINISFEKTRHLLLQIGSSSSFPISICSFKDLRSLLFKFRNGVVLVDALNSIGQNNSLKALSFSSLDRFDRMSGIRLLSDIGLKNLPSGMEKLMHLRYLDLSNNRTIEVLPKALCKLYNLQTLNIRHCSNLKELPQGIGKLTKLKHLNNLGCSSFTYMPKGIENLTCLLTLEEFHVDEGCHGKEASQITCLNKFPHLRGLLSIIGLGRLRNESEVYCTDLESKENIHSLLLDFSGPNSVKHEAILEALQPPPNLRGLTISYYKGSSAWHNWTRLTSLKSLVLVNWIEYEKLPSFENLSSLETLKMAEMHGVKLVGNEVLGLGPSSPFSSLPNLKSLRLWEMKEWEEWDCGIDDHVKVMPSLRMLEVYKCHKLKALPKQVLQMESLQVLVIESCSILSERYRKGAGDLWWDIAHIPNIQIDGENVQLGGH